MIPTRPPDITFRETTKPDSGLCRSGHTAVDMMFQGKPVRWFQMTCTETPEIDGVYCEPCLVVANYLKAQKKKRDKDG